MKNIRGMEALHIKTPTFNLEENWCRNMLEFRVTMFSQDGGTSVFLCHSTKCLIKHSTKDTPFNWRQGIDGGLNQPLILEGSDLLAQYTSESLPRYPPPTHSEPCYGKRTSGPVFLFQSSAEDHTAVTDNLSYDTFFPMLWVKWKMQALSDHKRHCYLLCY